jgi:hypothetical protein
VTLSDWARNGWLLPHRTSPREIADLLAIVDRDLADSRASGLSADWRLNIAYNAALQAATAAVAASGYRASRDQHHYRVIQSLELTIGADREVVNRLDAFRKKRNVGGYERAGAASEGEAREMRDLAQSIAHDVRAWLTGTHPDLLGSRGKSS